MHGTWDAEADAAYIDLRGDNDEVATRQIAAYTEHDRYEVILDVANSGTLLGVEVLGAAEAFDAATLRSFARIDNAE